MVGTAKFEMDGVEYPFDQDNWFIHKNVSFIFFLGHLVLLKEGPLFKTIKCSPLLLAWHHKVTIANSIDQIGTDRMI